MDAMGNYTTAGGARAQGAGGVHPARWGSQKDGGRAGGRLKPDVEVTIGETDRPGWVRRSLPSTICANLLLLTCSMSSICMSPTKMEETRAREVTRAGRFGDANDGC